MSNTKLFTFRATRLGQNVGLCTKGSLPMRGLAESWNVLDNELDEASDELLMSSLEFAFVVVGKHMFLSVCKSFAFVAGPCSIQCISIKHVWDCARDEVCTVGELLISKDFNVCQVH